MELIADLKYFPATDAMQWAASAKLDGRLVFQRNRRTVKMSFEAGRIVHCDSNSRAESFLKHLESSGLIDELDLVAVASQDKTASLGQTLVDLKILTRSQLKEAATEHTLGLACSVVPWPDGIVAVDALQLRPLADPESEPLEPFFAMMEATRRVDEMARLRETIPHDNVIVGPKAASADDDELSPAHHYLLGKLGAGRTVRKLRHEVGGCRFNFLKAVGELLSRGHLEVLDEGAPPKPPRKNEVTLVDVLLDSDLDRRLRA